MKALPTPDDLRALLRYEPETGDLYWLERGAEWFADGKDSAERRAKRWNARFSGQRALYSASASHGYYDGAVLGIGVLAHRVAFAIAHGRWPVGVDHIDGDRRNNRLVNLREADQAENMRNMKRRSDNKSGVAGIWPLRRGGWRARIKRSGIITDLGVFPTKEAAAEARAAAAQRLGFHPNHGRQA